MKNAKIILMDFPWDCQFGRQVQKGICRFAWPDRLWVTIRIFFSYDHDHEKWALKIPDTVGMITMRQPEEYTPVAKRYGLSVVGVGKWSPGQFSGLPYVDVDPKALGKMAADYFLDRGFCNFGMFNEDDTYHSLYRGDAFVSALRRRKISCDVFDPDKEYPQYDEASSGITDPSERILRWLASLPKPLAVFCIDDAMAQWVCAVCRRAEIRVPEEVAILGANDDDLLCEMAHPHLSSIQVPAEQVGFEAARLLDGMLSGKKPPKRPILLPPMGVVTRQSTDVLSVEDSYVVRAVKYIREHAHEGIFARNVIAEVRLSRRPLERRFQKALGRSPFAEIRRVQIEMVKTLLAQTDKTLEAMAPECGFKTVTRMNMAFKKATGMPPGAWRKQFHNR